jgi:hypothetical protein
VVLHASIDDVVLPEKVDVIISSSFGYALINGHGAEAFIKARDRFLKPGGKMYPSHATMFMCPFSEQALFDEQACVVRLHVPCACVCCVLCAVCCVLCAVCCVLCAVCCVLCAVCCVLCAVYMCVLCVPSPA